MVLRNCIVIAVVALVSHVIATPHGYGVKGGAGAVAKAEASASAGAFSGLPPIPIPIPSGGGFSGSYSKSSSSSFASSSASASSSSFSFSGSGANAVNGFNLNGGCSSGSCGCSTGACQNNGANEIKTSSNGDQGKYGTAAQSTAISNNQGIDCSSGQCDNKPNLDCTGADCPTYDKDIPRTNCKSDDCGQINSNSPNDIHVNVPGRTTKNPEEPFKYDTAANIQNPSSNGNPSISEPECNSYDCISPSQNPETEDEKRPSSYDVPIFGTTLPSYFPDKKEPCTSPDCVSKDSLNSNPIKPGYNNNLPEPQSTQECTGGSCTSQTAATPKPFTAPYDVPIPSGCIGLKCGSSNSVNIHTNQPTYNSPENCGSLGCSNAAQPQASYSKYPQTYESSGKSTPSHNYFSSTGLPNCKGPNCDNSGYSSTNLNTKQPSTFKYPGDCGTLGCGLTLQSGASNNENQASTKGSVNNAFLSGNQPGCNGFGCSTPSLGNGEAKQPYFSSPGDCGSSGCSPKTETSYSNNQPNNQDYGNSLDNTRCQGAYCEKPSYTNFGTSNVPSANCGPSGCSPHTTAGHIPSYNQPGYGSASSTPIQASPSPSQSWSSQSTIPPSSNGYTSSNSGASYKPTSPVSSPSLHSSSGNIPSYNQPGYGSVSSTPIQASPSPSQGWSSQSTISPSSNGYTNSNSGASYKPASPVSSPNTELVPPNQNSGVGINTKPYDAVNPNESILNNKPNTPGYTNGYDSTNIHQDDVTKPQHQSTAFPSSVLSSNPSYFPSTPQYSQNVPPKPVKGLDVKPFDSPKPNNNKQIYTGGFGGPKGPIDQSIPAKPLVTSTISPSTPSNIPSPYKPINSGSYSQNPIQSSPAPHVSVPQPSAPKDSKKGVPYNGGFGGPSGFLQPNDYSIPTSPSIVQPNGYGSIPTKQSPAYTPVTGTSNVAPCTSNNCGPKPSLATSLSSATHSGIANAHAQAAASAVAYTGGFGGPPGFLKPYDEGKVSSGGNIQGNPSSNSNGNLGHGNTNDKKTANGIPENGSGNTGAVAQANAVATSSAGGYGLNAGSNGGAVKGCSLGCGAPSGNGADSLDAHNLGINTGAVASAKSVAGAGSYGAGGGFASSSATAHASAGAAVKGGYGRR